MNSHQAIRGFLTFVLLVGVFATSYVGFTMTSSNTSTLASIDKNKPDGISVRDITKNSAVISWRTENLIVGRIIYSQNPEVCNGNSNNSAECIEIKEDIFPKSTHSIEITGLKPQTTYYVYIKMGVNTLYPQSGPLNFRTF